MSVVIYRIDEMISALCAASYLPGTGSAENDTRIRAIVPRFVEVEDTEPIANAEYTRLLAEYADLKEFLEMNYDDILSEWLENRGEL